MGACQHQLSTTQARVCSDAGILETRGDEAAQQMLDMTDGIGVDAALECAGTGQSMDTAFGFARVGSIIGAIGARHGVHLHRDSHLHEHRPARALFEEHPASGALMTW